MMSAGYSPPRSQRQSSSLFECESPVWSVISLGSLSFHRCGEHEWHPDGEHEHQSAGDQAEAGRSEAGDEAEGGHGEVVEGVLEGVALERLVDARHHHAASSASVRRARRRARAMSGRRAGARSRAASRARDRASLRRRTAGVVEVVVAVTYLGGFDDLREEGGQSDDAGRDAEAELAWGCKRHISAPLATARPNGCRAVAGSRSAALEPRCWAAVPRADIVRGAAAMLPARAG